MNAALTTRNPSAGEAVIAVFEEDVQRIPAPYRRFLLAHNGGTPSRASFEYFEDDGASVEMCVADFLGISRGHTSLQEHLEIYADRIPRDLFPIAFTPGGDLVLLARDDSPRAGKVLYWFHQEEADEGEEPDDRNIYPVADSFEAFLASLHE